MKLYHLNPNNYGQQYFVISDSRQNAFDAILNHLNSKSDDFYQEYLKMFKKGGLDNLPKKYTLDEYEVNQVIRSEIS
jgi:hypothetical protein